jgi:hypothetical protein
VRFTDFLRATVMTSAGAATVLAVITVLAASTQGSDLLVVFVSAVGWVVATAIGSTLGRRGETNPPIAKLLAAARFQTVLPELQPGRTLINRLWPLLLCTIAAGALAVIAPQVPGIACGFAIIWSLAWRRQDAAVLAIEERDGVTYYVERTSPVRPIQLVRTPGFRREVPTLTSVNGSGTG